MKNLNKKEIVYSILILTIPLVILFTTYFVSRDNSDKSLSQTDTVEREYSQKINVFNDVELLARSVIVKDINTGEVLYAKNPDISLPLASITKILTILTVDKLSQEELITISAEDLLAEGDSGFLVGENFKIQDLINLTLTTSSNDGAVALSSSVINAFLPDRKIDFIEEMNNFAREIGMERSRFYNETGLDENEKRAGAYGSANDVAELFEYAIKNKRNLLESTTKSNMIIKSLEGYIYNASNTNEIVDELPNLIAGKTGYTDIAGGNLAVVIDPFLNRPIVIVVLGSTQDGRFDDIKKLSEKTLDYFKN